MSSPCLPSLNDFRDDSTRIFFLISFQKGNLEEAGLVATTQGRLAKAPTDKLTVVEADEAVHGTHVLLPLVNLLSRLQVHKQPAYASSWK